MLIGREFDITSTLLYLYKDIESALPDFHHFLKCKTQLAAQSFNLTREDVKEIEKLFREVMFHVRSFYAMFLTISNAIKHDIGIIFVKEFIKVSKKILISSFQITFETIIKLESCLINLYSLIY